MDQWKLGYKEIQEISKLTEKSLWKAKHGKTYHFFCPLCGTKRATPMHPNPGGIRNFFAVFLVSLVFMMATWQWFAFKGLVIFLPIWVIFETVYRTLMRAKLDCAECGFDPILFLADAKKARAELSQYWRAKLDKEGIPYRMEKGKMLASPKNRMVEQLEDLKSQRISRAEKKAAPPPSSAIKPTEK